MRKCRDIDRAMAPISHPLHHGGILNRDWFSDRLNNNNNKCRDIDRAMAPISHPLHHGDILNRDWFSDRLNNNNNNNKYTTESSTISNPL